MTTNPEVLRLARKIVAANIDAWGWGPLEEIEGLSEHKLAIDAAIAAIERTTSLGALWLRTNPDAAHKPHDAFERYDHLRQSEKDNSDADS